MRELLDDRLSAAGVRLWLMRDSNKPRKLKYNLAAAREQGHRTLLTFGGAYSNHLRAVAAAGREHGFQTIGIVRGEQTLPLNESLSYCAAQGMRLSYLDRSAYRRWRLHLGDLRHRFGEFFLIPEGGSNALAVVGCAEIPGDIDREIGSDYDLVCCPVGTGGTLAGLAGGLPPTAAALGFSVLKGGDFLTEEVALLQQEAFGTVTPNWRIELGFHCGGYARRNAELDAFLADFHARHGIELEWVYVGKMMLGVFTLAARGRLPRRVVALVTA